MTLCIVWYFSIGCLKGELQGPHGLLVDYAYDDLKFGGNAQSITKDKWVHHTSFLWDYEPHLMKMLKHPPKQPEYRKVRNNGSLARQLVFLVINCGGNHGLMHVPILCR